MSLMWREGEGREGGGGRGWQFEAVMSDNEAGMAQISNQSVVEPLLEQFPLLLDQHDLLGVVLQRVLHLVGSRPRHVHPRRDWVLLVSEAIAIVLHEHVADALLLPLLLLLLALARRLTDHDVGNDLLEVLIVELRLALLLLQFGLRLGQRGGGREEVGPWPGDGVGGLLHLGVDAFPGLVLEDAGRLDVLLLLRLGRGLVPTVGEVEVVGEGVLVDGVRGVAVIGVAGEGVGLVEGEAAVVLGLLEDGRFVVPVLFVVVQHVLFLLGDEEAVLELAAFVLGPGELAVGLGLGLGLRLGLFLPEVVKGLDELLGEEALVLVETPALRPEGRALDVLDLELDDLARDRRDVDVEVRLHAHQNYYVTISFGLFALSRPGKGDIFLNCGPGLQFLFDMKKNSSQATLSKSSWAGKHGISKQNNGSALFGLNPNLNIEDEYIENLLKQIHFMNMEVKLLKEKQAQSEGNSLWGVINRTSQPLVSNIVDSNQKYQTMKKTLDTDLNKNEFENIRLADQQNAVLTKLNFLEKRIEALGAARGEQAASAAARQEKLAEKIGEYQGKLRGLQAEREEEGRRQAELSGQYEALLLEVERDRFATSSEMGRIRNEEEIEEVIEGERGREVQALKDKLLLLRQSLESSAEFQRAKEDQAAIRDSMALVLKGMAASEFELTQVEASIRLACEQKEREVIERKRLMEEFESLRVVLKELETLNASRLNQEVANRKRDSLDIQKGETQTRKLEKNLEEIRKKLARSEDSERALRQEMEHLEREVAKVKERRGELNEALTKLVTANDRTDTELTNFRNEYRRVQDQYEKTLQAELSSATDLNEIETEIVYLRQRKEFLSEALNLKEAINQTRLEELQKVVQKNKDVNETVGLLMDKWQEIRNFSKM